MKPNGHPPLSLVYVANSFVPSRAANTAHVLNMCAGFVSAGADVTLIARGSSEESDAIFSDFGLSEYYSLALHSPRPRLFDKPSFIWRIRFELRSRQGERPVVFGRSSYGLLAGVPNHVPMVYDIHTYPASQAGLWFERLLMKRRNLLFVTVTTFSLLRKYEEEYPQLAGRILVAPNGAPLPMASDDGDLKSSSRLQAYYVGHLYSGRGVELILDLARRQPEIDFHLVGGEAEDVRRWSAEAPRNATFHGYVLPSKLPDFYRHADVCLAPYQTRVAVAGGAGDNSQWMSPLKLFEYMAYGKPIISSDMPAIREVLTDGEDALLCPPEDVPAWQAAIQKVRDDRDLRRRLASASYSNAITKFSWKRRAELVLDRIQHELYSN